MLLNYLHRIARKLVPFRTGFLLFAALGGLGAGYGVMDYSDNNSTILRLSLMFTLWMLMLHACIQLFQTLPSPVLPGLSWWERSKQHLTLWMYQVLGIAVLMVGLALISLTLKLWFI